MFWTRRDHRRYGNDEGGREMFGSELGDVYDRLNQLAEVGQVNSALAAFDHIVSELPEAREDWPVAPTLLYNTVLKAMANRGDQSRAREWYDRMRKDDIRINFQTFGKLMEASMKAGDDAEALRWMSAMEAAGFPPQSINHAMIVDAHLRNEQPIKAMTYVEGVLEAGFPRDAVILVQAVNACVEAGEFEKAQAWITRMREAGLPLAAAYRRVIVGHVERGRAGVERVLDRMQEEVHPKDIISFVEVTLACVHAGRTDLVNYWYERMIGDGIKPTANFFLDVMLAFVQHRRPSDARLWFETMVTEEVRPTTAHYNCMIAACAESGDMEAAFKWFDRIREDGLQPEPQSFTHIIHALSQNKCVQEASEWLDRMEAAGLEPTLGAYAGIINAYAQAGQPEEASQWIHKAESQGVELDAVMYNILINAWAEVGNLDEALIVLDKQRRRGVDLSIYTYNSIMKAYVTAGKVEDAAALLHNMSSEAGVRPNSLSYNTVIHGFAKAGDVKRVKQLTNRMRAAGVEPDAMFYGSVGTILWKAGKKRDVAQLVELMGIPEEVGGKFSFRGPFRPNRYASQIAVQAYQEFFRIEELRSWLGYIRDNWDEQKPEHILQWGPLIRGCSVAGWPDLANEWNTRMLADGFEPKGKLAKTIQNALVTAQTRARRSDLAQLSMESVLSQGLEIDATTCNTLMGLLIEKGEYTNAIYWFNRTRDKGLRQDVRNYNQVILCCRRIGMPEEAAMWLDEMVADGVQPDIISFTTLMSAYVDAGRPSDEVVALLRRMETLGVKSDETAPYDIAIQALSEEGRIDDAVEILEVLEERDRAPNSVSYGRITSACAKADRVNEALAWLNQMEEGEANPNPIAYNDIIVACGRQPEAARQRMKTMAADLVRRMVGLELTPNPNAVASLQQILGPEEFDTIAEELDLSRRADDLRRLGDPRRRPAEPPPPAGGRGPEA
ncbi:unnamed protein product, partial [Prorocentrum cordatum]